MVDQADQRLAVGRRHHGQAVADGGDRHAVRLVDEGGSAERHRVVAGVALFDERHAWPAIARSMTSTLAADS